MFYRLKSLTLATLVFSLILPIGAAQSRTREIVQVPPKAQTQTTQPDTSGVVQLLQLGEHQLNKNQLQEALKTFQVVLIVVRAIKDCQLEGRTLHNIGGVYRKLKQYPKALEFYQQALTIRQQLNNKVGQGTTLNDIGLVYYNQQQYPKALGFYQQALAIYKEVGKKAWQGTTLHNIGLVYRQMAKYPQALEFYQQALTVRKDVGDRRGQGITLNDIGLVYYNQQQYPKALEFYQQALAIEKEVTNKADEGTTLDNIGLVYDKQEDYAKALDYYQQALVIRQQLKNKLGQATILKQIGEVYQKQYQYANALKLFEQALAIRKQIGEKNEQISILVDMGNLYKDIGKYAKALQYFEQALTIAKTIENKEKRILNEFLVRGYIALVKPYFGQDIQFSDFVNKPVSPISKDDNDSFNQDLYLTLQVDVIAREVEVNGKDIKGLVDYSNERLASYQRDLDNAAKQGKFPATYILSNSGKFYNAIGEYAKAQHFYQRALTANQRTNDKKEQGELLNYIGVTYYKEREYTKALEYFRQSATISQSIVDRSGEGFALSNMGATYNALGQYANAEKTLFEAINIFESLRSGLNDDQKISIFEIQTKAYIRMQKILVAQNKNDKALEVSERGRARAFVELLASKQSPNSNKINIKPPSIEEIKQIAKQQNATFVEYSINENQLYIWVVKPTGEIAFKQVDLKSLNTPLKDLVDKSRASIGAGGRGINVEPTGKPVQKDNLQKLHQVLIESIASLLPSNPDEHIIFIPHESLFLVPFVALQDKDGKYLIEKHTILTSPAIQVLELTHQQRQKLTGKDVLIMGNPTMPSVGVPPVQLPPLKYAEMEAKEIAKLENTRAIIGSNATKAAFKQKLPSARIIHLATHGLLDDADRSIPNAIALAPSGKDDGLLTPAEIVNLQINAELVVLSACDTGRGKITGDGVVGLSRSLITAGASSVIVSLWSIPDSSTSELMSDFYQRLQQNPDKAVALRQAMLNTMKKHPRPIFWAAFTLIGETK